MINELAAQLETETLKFKKWAKSVDKSYGEWETDYPYWDEIYDITEKLIHGSLIADWSEVIIKDFLYILARDIECENIIHQLIQNPIQLISLAKMAINYNDPNAKWQLAFGLGEVKGYEKETNSLLEKYILDDDEYVRRRASFALFGYDD